MRYNFCTLFDKNYLFKGLALHASLTEQCADFRLWVLCMDDVVFDLLKEMQLKHLELIRLSEFEDEELLEAKKSRSVAEYCWTCTPSLPLFVLKCNPHLEMITYLDADLFFYSDPAPVYEELGDNSIMIIEHRFPDYLKHLEINGIYNVQMMAFRNNARGIACLEWWRDRCNEWCFYRLEDGKLGDQKYLDDWTKRFDGVHVLQHIGAGVALWNVMQYEVRKRNKSILIDGIDLIFYHFHAFSLASRQKYTIGNNSNYPLTALKIELIYQPYFIALQQAMNQVKQVDSKFSHGFSKVDVAPLSSRIIGRAKSLARKLVS